LANREAVGANFYLHPISLELLWEVESAPFGACAMRLLSLITLLLALLACEELSAQTTIPQLPNNANIPAMAAAARAFSGRHSHPGGVAGPAQSMAMRQMQAQQMMMRQQAVAAQAAAAKKAEKKEKTREAATQLRERKEQAKKKALEAADDK
jgi:hypothetical protein